MFFPNVPMCAGHSLSENAYPYLGTVLTMGRRERHPILVPLGAWAESNLLVFLGM